jgi:23S rRNA (uracil1939-C5)-methyltransferase
MKRTLETTIAELTPGGEGVAIEEIDGERRAIFVPGVLGGERIRVEADFSRRPARARLLSILAPSPERSVPECRSSEECGGCDWMHLSLGEQSRAHAAIVASVLPPAFRETKVVAHPAPSSVGYRTRARLHVDARRGRVLVGMFERGSRDPVPVESCLVLDPILDRVRGSIASWLEGAKGRGEAQLALGRPGDAPRKAVLDLRWNGDLAAPVFGRIERAVAEGVLAGARLFAGDVKVPAKIGDPTPWITGADGAPLRLAPGGFSQATEEANTLLARRACELADAIAPGATTFELFAGAGNLTVLLARTRAVTAVEIVREACEAARTNLSARGLGAKVVEADAAVTAIPKDAKLVVLDPPRVGAKEVARALAARPVPAVVYVSCDPPTLGRDLAMLAEAGYRLEAIETFEMFPHTSHVETVAALVPPDRGTRGKK